MFGLWKDRGAERDAIRTVTHRLEDVERELRGLKAEWLEMYDKLTRRDDRIRKRQERETAPDPAPMTPQDVKAALRARMAGRGTFNGHP